MRTEGGQIDNGATYDPSNKRCSNMACHENEDWQARGPSEATKMSGARWRSASTERCSIDVDLFQIESGRVAIGNGVYLIANVLWR